MWDVRAQSLYYIDNSGRKIHNFNPATGASRTWEMPAVITTLVLCESGAAIVTLRSGIHFFDFESGKLEVIRPLPDPPPYVFNDGKADARGRFLIGASTANSAHPAPDGGLFQLDPACGLHRLDSGIHYSNGPCWSPDNRTLYFSDSWINTVYAYDYDIETGSVSNRRVFANTSEIGGLPDGATVDADGLYWVAIFRAGKIAAYRSDGRLERLIELPVKLVSSITFGGPSLDRLYVTTMSHAPTEAQRDDLGADAGSLFVIEDIGACGRAEHRFAG